MFQYFQPNEILPTHILRNDKSGFIMFSINIQRVLTNGMTSYNQLVALLTVFKASLK